MISHGQAVADALRDPHPDLDPEMALIDALRATLEAAIHAQQVVDPAACLAAWEDVGAYFDDTVTLAMRGVLDDAENQYDEYYGTTAEYPGRRHPGQGSAKL